MNTAASTTGAKRAFNGFLISTLTRCAFVLRHPALTLLVMLVTLGINVYLSIAVPKGFFPQQDTGRLMGQVQGQQNISFQAMQANVRGFVRQVLSDPAVENVVAFTGGQGGTNTARFFVSLKDLDVRKVSADTIIARIRQKTSGTPGATLFMQAVQDIRVGGRMSNAQYQFTIQSQNLDDLNQWAPRVLDKLRTLHELEDVNTDQQNNGLQAGIVIDRDTASRLGLTAQNIDDALYSAFGQRQVSTMYTPLNQYHVVMEVAPEYWQSPQTLRSLYVHTTRGADVPLSAFTKFSPGNTPLAINH